MRVASSGSKRGKFRDRAWYALKSVLFGLLLLPGAAACGRTALPAATAGPRPTATPALALATGNDASVGCVDPVPLDRDFGLTQWPRTNFCLHSVPYDEIHSGGVGRDVIAAIDRPRLESVGQAAAWLVDNEPVLYVVLSGEARAYPLQILVWHEIVNDVVAGRAVVVTYCPLCSAGLVFERNIAGRLLDFGTTGNLRHADLIMYDRQTESWWQQFTGEALVGEMTGTQLPLVPSAIIAWRDFRAHFPDGRVLSEDTGYERLYGETPYVNYDSLTNPRAGYLAADPDPRLPPKMRVLALTLGDEAVAYPYALLAEKGVVHNRQGGQEVVVLWQGGTVSPLYARVIAESRDVGSAAAFSPLVDGRALTFNASDGDYVDTETGSRWNLLGTAVAGPLAGRQLQPLPANEYLWFAWAAFEPETVVFEVP